MDGTVANFDGNQNSAWFGSASEKGVSVQGNMITGADVVNETLRAYTAAEKEGKTIAERLLLAMEAGGAKGGDVRAKPNGYQSGLTAYLIVSQKNDKPRKPSLALIAPPPKKGESPIVKLRKQYDSLVVASLDEPLKNQRYLPEQTVIFGTSLVVPVFLGFLVTFFVRRWKLILYPVVTSLVVYALYLWITSAMNWVLPFYDYLT